MSEPTAPQGVNLHGALVFLAQHYAGMAIDGINAKKDGGGRAAGHARTAATCASAAVQLEQRQDQREMVAAAKQHAIAACPHEWAVGDPTLCRKCGVPFDEWKKSQDLEGKETT